VTGCISVRSRSAFVVVWHGRKVERNKASESEKRTRASLTETTCQEITAQHHLRRVTLNGSADQARTHDSAGQGYRSQASDTKSHFLVCCCGSSWHPNRFSANTRAPHKHVLFQRQACAAANQQRARDFWHPAKPIASLARGD